MQVTRLGLYGGPRAPYAGFVAAVSASISGTATVGITEVDIVAGGKTIIITLANDDWLAAGFDGQRQNIIDGLNSDGAEDAGWNAAVRDTEIVSAVVRTSNTVVTITLTPATYNIVANETITVTIPSTALVLSINAIIGEPAFTVIPFITISSRGASAPRGSVIDNLTRGSSISGKTRKSRF